MYLTLLNTFLISTVFGLTYCELMTSTHVDTKGKNVMILYVKEDCEFCDTWESKLFDISEEVHTMLDATSVKVILENDGFKKYGAEEFPFMMYHHTESATPLLIDFLHFGDELLNTLRNTKFVKVHELDDLNFEHDTQAATGSTTGSWLVYFASEKCDEDCQMFLPKLEFVAARLSGRINVAIMKPSTSKRTIKRFNLDKFPILILFHHGKMFKLDESLMIDSINLHSLLMQNEFDVHFEDVPAETPEILDNIYDCLEIMYTWKGTIFLCIFSIAFCFFAVSYQLKLKSIKKSKGKSKDE